MAYELVSGIPVSGFSLSATGKMDGLFTRRAEQPTRLTIDDFLTLQMAYGEPKPPSIPYKVKNNLEVVICGPEDHQYVYLYHPHNDIELEFQAKKGKCILTERVPNPDKQGTLVAATYRINYKDSELVKLKEFSEVVVKGVIAVSDGQKPWVEYQQVGFHTNGLSTKLGSAMRQEWPVAYVKFRFPVVDQPRRWVATLILRTFGKITEKQMYEVQELYRRVYECEIRLYELSQKASRTETLQELLEEEKKIYRCVETQDVISRRTWMERYENIVEDVAFAKTRDMWLDESARLTVEQNTIFDGFENEL